MFARVAESQIVSQKQQTRRWAVNPQSMAAVGQIESRDIWLTPRWILEHLGSFDLDPCAFDGEPMRCAPRYFTEAEDGLRHIWEGRVFCNPPFSNTAGWLDRCAGHCNGISLVPASVDSIVWRNKVWKYAKGVYLLHGRTQFCNPDGSTTTGRPLRSIALIGWHQADALILARAPFAGVFVDTWRLR